jgi:MFS family permease
MSPPRRRPSAAHAILFLTFIESLATVLLERGVYFYTHDVLDSSERDNLLLATAFGVTYVAGALSSHRVAARFGERRLLVGSLVVLLGVHLALSCFPTAVVLAVSFPLIGLLQGIKWPVVESFVSAGHSPSELLSAVGRFNVTWAASVPIALVISGPLIASGWAGSMFLFAAGCNVLALLSCLAQPAQPLHLDAGHPTRPNDDQLGRLRALLGASRWSMLLSYALLFLLAPLLPEVLEGLGLGVTEATQVAAVPDLARVLSFWVLGAWAGWHGRAWPLVVAIAVLPLAFLLTLFGDTVSAVIAGELVFGICSGLLYMAALYYAMVVKNAAVEAGGAHEGLIGLGFALGPLTGLAAHWLEPTIGGRVGAVLVSLLPMCLICTALALARLRPTSGV